MSWNLCNSKEDLQLAEQRLHAMTELNRGIQQFYQQFSQNISQCFWIYDLAAETHGVPQR